MTTLEAPDIATGVNLPRPGAWSLHWRGRVFREADLTGQHLSTLALLSGSDDYSALDLDPRNGHQRLMQMLMAFLTVEASAKTSDPDDLSRVIASMIDVVAQAPVDELLGALRYD